VQDILGMPSKRKGILTTKIQFHESYKQWTDNTALTLCTSNP